MSDAVDKEVEAIKIVLAALTPLSAKARASVLEYAMKRLDITDVSVPPVSGAPPKKLPPSKADIEDDGAPKAPNELGEEDEDLLKRLEEMAEEVEDDADSPKGIPPIKK